MNLRLNENQLKMIAAVSMVIDHVGYFLFPQVTFLRWIGRIAFPLFAFFIAEGCYYTRNILRYFGQVAVLGLICMAATLIFDGSLYGNTLITFALSILSAAMFDLNPLIGLFFLGPVLWLTMQIEIDYGFVGILIPVICVLVRRLLEKNHEKYVRPAQILVMAAGLFILAFQLAPYQWMGLFALPLLLLYDGQRGTMHLKWFFYLFYPVHIVVIQIIGLLFFQK